MEPVAKKVPEVSRLDFLRFLSIRKSKGILPAFDFITRKYGQLFIARIKKRQFFIVTDPFAIKHILVTQNRHYSKAALKARLVDVLGEGLFTSDGSFWKRQRQLVQPAFGPKQLGIYAENIVEKVQKLTETLKNNAGTTLDIYPHFVKFTLDVVMETILGSESKKFHQEVHDAITVIINNIESQSFTQRIIDLIPQLKKLVQFKKYLENIFCLSTHPYAKAKQDFDRILLQIVSERRLHLGQGNSQNDRDVLSLLLKAKDEHRQGMSDRQLRDELAIAFVAGHETSAVALTWTLVLLAQNPLVGERLFQELDAVLQRATPTLAVLERLPYTRAVIMESLRLYPPIWRLVRTAEEDDIINGVHIPRNATLVMLPFMTHRLEKFWPQAEVFDPNRFLGSAEADRRDQLSYLPFGAGPRICIGQNFAMNEMTLALASVWQNLRLELAESTNLQIDARLTLRPKYPIKMLIHKR